MSVATALRNAARSLINAFGNTATIYSYSSATKTENDEGDVTVSSWGSGTTTNVVDGGSQGHELLNESQGLERIGEDEKIIRDDVTIAVNDRLNYNNQDYRVTGLRSERVQSTDIIQIISVSEVTSTSSWTS